MVNLSNQSIAICKDVRYVFRINQKCKADKKNQNSSNDISSYSYFIIGYRPHGPQTNVALTTITDGGWELCYSSRYDSRMTESTTSTIKNSQCTKAKILVGCRYTNSPNNIRTLAWAPRNCVFAPTGSNYHNTTTCEGTDWYFNHQGSGHSSMGFAKEGDGVNHNNCDFITTGCNECRLCWLLDNWSGYRCGSDIPVWSGNYERVIFQTGKI